MKSEQASAVLRLQLQVVSSGTIFGRRAYPTRFNRKEGLETQMMHFLFLRIEKLLYDDLIEQIGARGPIKDLFAHCPPPVA